MDNQLQLLMEIKGDLGEAHGIAVAMRTELDKHWDEDRSQLARIDGRLNALERMTSENQGAARAHEKVELRIAGVVAVLIAGAVSLLGNLFPHWWWGK